jgi:hypothetical protein
MKRFLSGLLFSYLFVGIVAPPVGALPGEQVGYYAAFCVLAFISIVTWLACKSVKSTTTLLATVAAAIVCAFLESHTNVEAIFTPVAGKIYENVLVCEGGCGIARFSGLVTGITVLSLVTLFVPLARSLCRVDSVKRFMVRVFDATI